MSRLYQGEYECPQCGMGSKDLKPEALAKVTRNFGSTVRLFCQICDRVFLVNLGNQLHAPEGGWVRE